MYFQLVLAPLDFELFAPTYRGEVDQSLLGCKDKRMQMNLLHHFFLFSILV